MLKINSNVPAAYVSPAVRVAQLHSRRMVCVSTGNLNQDYYSDSGYAGGNAEEEDGGGLF